MPKINDWVEVPIKNKGSQYEQLKAAGFTEAEILKDAGFSDKEINDWKEVPIGGGTLTEERRTQLDGIVQKMMANNEPDENVQAVVNDFKSKYGGKTGWDAIPNAKPGWVEPAKATLEGIGLVGGGIIGAPLGPVGAVGGAGLGYAGMKAVGRLGEELLGYAKPTTPLETGIRTAKDIATGGAMEAGGQVIGKGLEIGGKYLAGRASRWYESALKIPPSVPNDIRQKIVQTGIKGQYYPTQNGLARLQGDIESLNHQIANSVDTASQTGGKIDMADVTQRIDQLKGFYNRLPPDRAKVFTDQLDEIQSQYLSGGEISQKAAQQMKQTIYTLHKKHYGELKTLAIEGDKAVARGLKEELVKLNPELASLNAKDSALINLEEVMERAVNRTRNYDVIKLGDTIMSTTGAVLSGPGGAGGLLAARKLLGAPPVKSALAFALSKANYITGQAAGRPMSYLGAKIGMTQD